MCIYEIKSTFKRRREDFLEVNRYNLEGRVKIDGAHTVRDN